MNSFVSHNNSLPGKIIILKLVWPRVNLYLTTYFWLLILLASLRNVECLLSPSFSFFFFFWKIPKACLFQKRFYVESLFPLSLVPLCITGPHLTTHLLVFSLVPFIALITILKYIIFQFIGFFDHLTLPLKWVMQGLCLSPLARS